MVALGFIELGAGPLVDVAADEVRDRVDIELARFGTISGYVYDEIGDPVQGAAGQVLRSQYERGRQRLVTGPSSSVPIDFDAASANVANAEIAGDWTFQMTGVNGARRLSLTRAPEGWALEQIRVNGIDVTDRRLTFGRKDQSLTDVEVVLTDRLNVLTGTIRNSRGAPADGARIVVFSTDRGRWYPLSRFVRIAMAAADGTYTCEGLPDGSYYAAPLASLPSGDEEAWQDPSFLEELLRRADTVTLTGAAARTLQSRLP